jgi:hypothetical protein
MDLASVSAIGSPKALGPQHARQFLIETFHAKPGEFSAPDPAARTRNTLCFSSKALFRTGTDSHALPSFRNRVVKRFRANAGNPFEHRRLSQAMFYALKAGDRNHSTVIQPWSRRPFQYPRSTLNQRMTAEINLSTDLPAMAADEWTSRGGVVESD